MWEKYLDEFGKVKRPFGYDDAVTEASLAAEHIVIPRQQAIELMPQTAELLEVQVSPALLHMLRHVHAKLFDQPL